MPNEPFSPYLRPVVQRGEYIRLSASEDIYKVLGMSPQPGVTQSITVAANSSNQQSEITALKQRSNVLAQYRVLRTSAIPNGVTVTWDSQGANNPMYNTANQQGTWDSNTIGDTVESNLTEMYAYGDPKVYASLSNTNSSSSTVNFRFSGFEYVLAQSATPEENLPTGESPVPVPTGPID